MHRRDRPRRPSRAQLPEASKQNRHHRSKHDNTKTITAPNQRGAGSPVRPERLTTDLPVTRDDTTHACAKYVRACTSVHNIHTTPKPPRSHLKCCPQDPCDVGRKSLLDHPLTERDVVDDFLFYVARAYLTCVACLSRLHVFSKKNV